MEFNMNWIFLVIQAQGNNDHNWLPCSTPVFRIPEISCPDPGTPLYGSRDSDDLTFGSEIGFTCEDGFKLLGQTSIRCLATGEWYGKAPTCEREFCHFRSLLKILSSDYIMPWLNCRGIRTAKTWLDQ